MGGACHVGVARAVHGDALATVVTAAPEEGGVDEGGAGGIELRREGGATVYRTAIAEGLEGPGCRREVGGSGAPRHVGVARAVHGDAVAEVIATPAEVGGVDEGGAGGIEFRHEGGTTTVLRTVGAGRLEGSGRRREVGGGGRPSYIGVARAVHGDALAPFVTVSPEVGRIDEGGTGGTNLRYEGVRPNITDAAAEHRLEGPRRRWEVPGGGDACHVGAARAVHGDARAGVSVAASEVCGVDEG